MTEEKWVPLGVESDDEVAAYDALHDGVPEWMRSAYWAWVMSSLGKQRRYSDGSGSVQSLNIDLTTELAQTLQIPLPPLSDTMRPSPERAKHLRFQALKVLENYTHPLRIADYILAHQKQVNVESLEGILKRCKSLYEVGERFGRPGLVRRVPLGVKINADAVMRDSGQSGIRLAQAWESLYGITPDASRAYALAIKAVEDIAVPLVAPSNGRATLGTLIRQMEDQGDWGLPMAREPQTATSSVALLTMMKLLWHGQHDRHGGQPSAPGNVSFEEAQVAVSLAANLVQLFAADLVARAQP
ncbi:hypothetical protein ACU18_15380 [Arthrobacter sp. ZBG10]|uniref:hypothetical protein n=1 Tax=Arthrobacter sp. ZBG10 TaxID=1676590 RepID=UPI000681323A|nr:hypothetical protein [Arthrobacter sp. ZBG10]KNH15985.1 hypothetical protein ACU18_15380 [Arthrobacter sp. ZBG10]